MSNSSNNINASTVATQTVVDLKDLIARGNYDYLDQVIVGKTPIQFRESAFGLEPRVFQFERSLDPKVEMDKSGYRPATIWDLLEYGIKNPDEQRLYPIVALGTEIVLSKNTSVTAYLDGDSTSRGLYADWGYGLDFEVDDEHDVARQDYLKRRRFLGVKK